MLTNLFPSQSGGIHKSKVEPQAYKDPLLLLLLFSTVTESKSLSSWYQKKFIMIRAPNDQAQRLVHLGDRKSLALHSNKHKIKKRHFPSAQSTWKEESKLKIVGELISLRVYVKRVFDF